MTTEIDDLPLSLCKIPGQTLCRRLLTIWIGQNTTGPTTTSNRPSFTREMGGCVLMPPNATLCLHRSRNPPHSQQSSVNHNGRSMNRYYGTSKSSTIWLPNRK